jgi:hypothetical protein
MSQLNTMKITKNNLNENISKWEGILKGGRKNKELILSKEVDNCQLIVGEKNKYSFSIIFSSKTLIVGKLILSMHNYSEVEEHEGDELIFVTKGVLVVGINNDGVEFYNPDRFLNSVYEVNKDEKMFIPRGFKHVYKNIDKNNVEAIVGISPSF